LIGEVLERTLCLPNPEEPRVAGDVHHSVQRLVKCLQNDPTFDRDRLARIEWGFLPLLDPEFSEVGPDTLVKAIDADAGFFVELLKKVYRGEKDQPDERGATEEEQLMARNASKLLDGLRRLPGNRDGGRLDCEYLGEWLRKVRELAGESGHGRICDFVLGQFIARGSQRRVGNWPVAEVASVLETIGTEELFRGFTNGILNSRGVVSRDPTAGGEPERKLASRYRQLSQYARPSSPKLAEAFLALALHYEADAQREDDMAHRKRLGR
jgi:hypothetical protein